MNIVKNKKVAITGSMGSGKSNVANIFKEEGFDVFDADECNRRLLETIEVRKQLGELFPEVFDDNKLNKMRLRQLIFTSQNAKQKLEMLMHPLILKEMSIASFNKKIFIAEIPTLFESNWDQYFDEIIVVAGEEAIIKKRLIAKGLTSEDIEKTWENQLSNAQKIEKATTVFYNNRTLKDLRATVMKWIKENENGNN